MADLANLKQVVIDVFLGGKQFELGGQQVEALKAYDPDLDVFRDTLTTELIAGAKARRALIALKPNDLMGFVAAVKAHRAELAAVAAVVDDMMKKKVMGASVPPAYVIPLGEARKKDLLAIEKEQLGPAVERYLHHWQQAYAIENGRIVEKESEQEESEEEELDPALVKKAHADTDQIMTLMAHEKTLFGGKSLLNAAEVSTFAKDKLSFLPTAVRGGDTKKLLAEEKLAVDAIKNFETACAKGPAAASAAYELWKVNGKAVRMGMPLFIWKNKPALVAYRDELVQHLYNIRQHLGFWMDQRTTARLDLKSKKVIACVNLAGEVDKLVEAYGKVI